MMTNDQILQAANLAYHEQRIADWRMCHSLLSILGFMPDGYGALVSIVEETEKARLRHAMRQPDPHQQDVEEYDQEMGLGGRRFRS